jgi:UDP-4-amino-4,6-dideoxy-N-acetyl-beta-L-altrosamine N-acetyltransferase
MRLEGERLSLVPLQPRHTGVLLKWRSDPSILAQLYSDRAPTPEEHRRWLARLRRDGTRREFVIVLREGARPIGTIGLSAIDAIHRKAEYGILIGEHDAEGLGFAREASEVLLRFAFRDLGLNRIYLRVFGGNRRAVALYERLGFRREGVLREDAWKKRRRLDVLLMSLLRNEWQSPRGGGRRP